jgi:hypothetical protein
MRVNNFQPSEEEAEVQMSEIEYTSVKISAVEKALEDVLIERDNIENIIQTLRVCKDDLNKHKFKLLEDQVALMSLIGYN